MKYFLSGCVIWLVTLAGNAAMPEVTRVFNSVSPAVVNISTSVERRPTAQFDDDRVPEFLRHYFRQFDGNQPPVPAAGSGFIISKDGYILTNNHVVEGADKITVALGDRREREAKLIGADPLSDLALLKIDVDNLPTVEFGSSENLEVGEWVVAIGSPFGFELSVTAGIVSAKQRSLRDQRNNYIPFIQTDVAINPGNSGGPLLDMSGKVVGINSQIFTRSGGFMGLSFAIPVDVAMEVVAQLKESGKVSRGYLGVQIQPVDRDLAESFGLDRPSGALVSGVYADSPAGKAGIREGDIITQFNGKAIDLSSDLPFIVGRTKADSEVPVEVVRDGKRETVRVNVGRLPDEAVAQMSAGAAPAAINRLGVEVEEIDDETKSRLVVEKGVVVVSVGEGAGRLAGIQPGDVITTLDHTWVESSAAFEQLVARLPANVAVPIRIVRNGRPEFRVVKILE